MNLSSILFRQEVCPSLAVFVSCGGVGLGGPLAAGLLPSPHPKSVQGLPSWSFRSRVVCVDKGVGLGARTAPGEGGGPPREPKREA